jgi:hypothetical protein
MAGGSTACEAVEAVVADYVGRDRDKWHEGRRRTRRVREDADSRRLRRYRRAQPSQSREKRGSELVGQLHSLLDSRLSRYIAPRLPQSPSTGVLIDVFRFIVAFDRRRSRASARRLLLFLSIAQTDSFCSTSSPRGVLFGQIAGRRTPASS